MSRTLRFVPAARTAAAAALLLALSTGCGSDGPDVPGSDVAAADDAAAQEAETAPGVDPDPETGAGDGDGDGDPTAVPGLESVRIFFPSASGDGLVGETREIFETSTPGDRIKQIVADLLGGPQSRGSLAAVPQGTALLQAYVDDGGTAYLDFSPQLADGLGGGSLQEMLTVYAIVDSVVLNVREVRRVVLLISGRPVDTLNGHMDLRRPVSADRSWIL